MTHPSKLPPEMQVLMTTVVAEAAKAAALTASALCEAYVTFFGPIMGNGPIGEVAREAGIHIAAGLIEVNMEARGK